MMIYGSSFETYEPALGLAASTAACRRAMLTALIGQGSLGCSLPTSTSTDTETEQAASAPDPAPLPACNAAVPDAAAARKLALDAKLLAGFAPVSELVGSHADRSRGFRMGPMVPSTWPSTNCAVVFYVYEAWWSDYSRAWHHNAPVSAAITLHLDTGATSVAPIQALHLPRGVFSRSGENLAGPDEQPVFDAVARRAPLDLAGLANYQQWLLDEPYFVATLDIIHPTFLAEVLSNRGDILELAHEGSNYWVEILGTSGVGRQIQGGTSGPEQPAPAVAPDPPLASASVIRPCNSAIADASAAMTRALSAKLASDRFVVPPDTRFSQREFILSPMVPASWPSNDCTVVFYVHELHSMHQNPEWTNVHHAPVSARISVQLATGDTVVEPIEPSVAEDLPSGRPRTTGSPLSGADQQPVFDVVAHRSLALDLSAMVPYQRWLRHELVFAATLDILHPEFLADALANRGYLRDRIRERSEYWYQRSLSWSSDR